MLDNLLNSNDLLTLLKMLKRPQEVFSMFMRTKDKKVKNAWSHTTNPPVNWWDIPAVRKRWNYLISGNPETDYKRYIIDRHFPQRQPLVALSLCCGTGTREIDWARLANFQHMDAYDLSESRIMSAIAHAKHEGLNEIINYRACDIFQIEIPENVYDVVFAESSLHHLSPLNEILIKVNRCLKPGGFFIVNEFVGPTRFQWTDRQLQVIDGILSILPNRYKTFWNSTAIKQKVIKPSRLRMILNDPSEAVESSNIVSLVYKIFDVVEVKEYGGTILHMLLSGIAHNFLSEDDETSGYLKLCFDVEDLLLATQQIESDYMIAVCKKMLPPVPNGFLTKLS
jgi:ubiquinone/menaquinone biosynthesis C-methylase UbiE